MKKKKINQKAFTLIELLAVLVILAVIALIAVPIIIGIIEDARRDAFVRSVEIVVSTTTMDMSIEGYMEGHRYRMEDGVISNFNIDMQNTKGMYGDILYEKNGNVTYVVHNNEWCVAKTPEIESPLVKKYEEGKCLLEDIMELPIVSIKVIQQDSKEEIESDIWTKEKLNFILKDEKNIETNKLYYCVDTEDRCNPTIEVKSEEVSLENTGIFYIRYKIVNEMGIESLVESFKGKVDTIAPIIEDIKVTYTDDTATIRVLANDKEGIGIEAYCLLTVDDASQCDWISSTENYQDFPDQKTGIYYAFVKDKFENISAGKLTSVIQKINNFEYTNGEQTYVVPQTGYYKLEVWGAQGGSVLSWVFGGRGGYSVGVTYLTQGQTLYINVGGAGSSVQQKVMKIEGGYNGGGMAAGQTNKRVGSGGGATHIATVPGVLSSLSEQIPNILIVAGGGGGAVYEGRGSAGDYVSHGGAGGGINGMAGANDQRGTGGTQEAGGSQYGYFGHGGDEISDGSGGGGGFYGGGRGKYYSSGGGGSGYIGGVISYGDITAQTIAGNESFPNTEGTAEETGHGGNGYAKITYMGE